jgi:hypothetical protein
MTLTYEVIIDISGTEMIKATDETGFQFWIPMYDSNVDYQIYLASLNEVPA